MKFPRILIFLILLSALLHGAENQWKVRYNGGPLKTASDQKTWDNTLAITPDELFLSLKDGQSLHIPARAVTGLSYGQEAYRRLTSMIAVFGFFHKSREHLIGIEYTLDYQKDGLLLQADKDDYRSILSALRKATEAPIAVSDEDDRRFVADLDEPQPPANTVPETGSLVIAAEPPADVYIDSNLAGKTPCTIEVPPGRHHVTLVSPGYTDWIRDLKISRGEAVKISATLEKARRR